MYCWVMLCYVCLIMSFLCCTELLCKQRLKFDILNLENITHEKRFLTISKQIAVDIYFVALFNITQSNKNKNINR